MNAAGGEDVDDVLFTGTISGTRILTVTAANLGDVTFQGAVGGTASPTSNPQALTSLTVSGNVLTLQNVNTNTGQTYTAANAGASIIANNTYQNNTTGAITFNGPVTLQQTTATSLSVTNRGGDGSADIVFNGTINMLSQGPDPLPPPAARPLTLTTATSTGGSISVSGNITNTSTFSATSGSGDVAVAGVAATSTQVMSGRDINVGGTLSGTTVTATATRDLELHDVTTTGITATVPNSTVDQDFRGRNITLNSDYVTTGPGTIRFRGDVQLANDVFVSTIGGANSDIVMVGRITGNRALELNTLSNTNRTAASVELGDTRATVSGNNIDIGDLLINDGIIFDRTAINGTVVISGRDANGLISDVTGFTYRIRTSGDFTMQQQEKLVVLGNLQLDADTATISDITAVGDITINANEIRILRRPAGKVVQFSDGRPNGDLQDDLGVDYVAGGDIAFNAPTITTVAPGGSALRDHQRQSHRGHRRARVPQPAVRYRHQLRLAVQLRPCQLRQRGRCSVAARPDSLRSACTRCKPDQSGGDAGRCSPAGKPPARNRERGGIEPGQGLGRDGHLHQGPADEGTDRVPRRHRAVQRRAGKHRFGRTAASGGIQGHQGPPLG